MLLVTMVLMGLATTGIGLLPSYASAGIWAPIGLIALRIVQGSPSAVSGVVLC